MNNKYLHPRIYLDLWICLTVFLIEEIMLLPKRLFYYLSAHSTEATYPSCSNECCHQQRGWNALNKRAQSVLTFMARTTSTLLNGLRITLQKALLNYMLMLILRLQEYHISFLQALHRRYHLRAICYMGDPSPWRRRFSPVMDRHPKLASSKLSSSQWPSSK